MLLSYPYPAISYPLKRAVLLHCCASVDLHYPYLGLFFPLAHALSESDLDCPNNLLSCVPVFQYLCGTVCKFTLVFAPWDFGCLGTIVSSLVVNNDRFSFNLVCRANNIEPTTASSVDYIQYHYPSFSRCAITEEPDLHVSAIEPSGSNDLGVSRDKINGLIAPLDVFTLNVQNDALYRFLGGKMHGFSVITYLDNQPQIFDGRELDKFERLRPTP